MTANVNYRERYKGQSTLCLISLIPQHHGEKNVQLRKISKCACAGWFPIWKMYGPTHLIPTGEGFNVRTDASMTIVAHWLWMEEQQMPMFVGNLRARTRTEGTTEISVLNSVHIVNLLCVTVKIYTILHACKKKIASCQMAFVWAREEKTNEIAQVELHTVKKEENSFQTTKKVRVVVVVLTPLFLFFNKNPTFHVWSMTLLVSFLLLLLLCVNWQYRQIQGKSLELSSPKHKEWEFLCGQWENFWVRAQSGRIGQSWAKPQTLLFLSSNKKEKEKECGRCNDCKAIGESLIDSLGPLERVSEM